MIETCKHCGTEFEARRTERTCSVACAKAAQAAYMREYYRKRRQSDPEFRAAEIERDRLRAHRKASPEYKAKQAAGQRKRLSDPEAGAARAEYYRERRRTDPEFRAAHAARERRYHRKRKAETVSRMLAMLNSGELAAYGTEPYFLYRFYDENDTLLYIGITNDPERRLYQHTAEKPWAGDIARTEYAVFPNKTSAAAAEAALIKELGPLHNIVHNSVIKIPLTANETRC